MKVHELEIISQSTYLYSHYVRIEFYTQQLICSCTPLSTGSHKLCMTEHPQSQVVTLGSTATLSCKATGCDDISYVCYMSGLSHTSPEYKIVCMTEEDEGIYSCEVSSSTHSLMPRMARVSLAK